MMHYNQGNYSRNEADSSSEVSWTSATAQHLKALKDAVQIATNQLLRLLDNVDNYTDDIEGGEKEALRGLQEFVTREFAGFLDEYSRRIERFGLLIGAVRELNAGIDSLTCITERLSSPGESVRDYAWSLYRWIVDLPSDLNRIVSTIEAKWL